MDENLRQAKLKPELLAVFHFFWLSKSTLELYSNNVVYFSHAVWSGGSAEFVIFGMFALL